MTVQVHKDQGSTCT